MPQHRVVLLPGDGIGPEITAGARQLLEAVSARHGFTIEFSAVSYTHLTLPTILRV